MRVLILCDAAAPDPGGALHTQLRSAAAALNRLPGVEAQLAPRDAALLPRFDVVHVVGAAGAAAGALAAARACGCPVVLSPRLSPAWSSANGTRARVADRVQGNRSACDLDTGYARLRRALDAASLVVAQSEAERKAIGAAFLLAPGRIRVVPPGIAPCFFDAGPALFRRHARIAGSFALMVGRVSPYFGQAGVANALAGLALPLVVIGDARERDAGYLRELRSLRTVTCLGTLAHDDPLLASACAAASVFVHAGHPSGWPMAAAEALAAGTPVVAAGAAPAARKPGVGALSCPLPLVDAGRAWRHAPWHDAAALQEAVAELLDRPPARAAVSSVVRAFTWDRVAAGLLACYREALAQAVPG